MDYCYSDSVFLEKYNCQLCWQSTLDTAIRDVLLKTEKTNPDLCLSRKCIVPKYIWRWCFSSNPTEVRQVARVRTIVTLRTTRRGAPTSVRCWMWPVWSMSRWANNNTELAMIAVAMHCVMCNSILQTPPPAAWPRYYPLLNVSRNRISSLSRCSLELSTKLCESFQNIHYSWDIRRFQDLVSKDP